MKTLLALATAAVAISAIPAAADARRVCTEWRHGRCVAVARVNNGWHRGWRNHRDMNRGSWDVGYRVPQSYSYYDYNRIPRTYVSRYNLNPDERYVYRNNHMYVVNPTTYAVERILGGL